MKQLTPMDSHFFYFEAPNQPMMIGSLWLCDQRTAPGGLVRHKDILQYVSDRLNTTSYFRRRLEQAPLQLDDPYWLEDENFDLEYHVRHVGLPQPGDWRQLCIFTARTMSRSVDMERAPWEIYIIEGVNRVEGMPEGSFAVLIRFHHAYVDGKSSLELSTAMMEATSEHKYGLRPRVEVAERAPTRLEMWARTTPRMIGQSFRSMRAGVLFTRKAAELAWRMRAEPEKAKLRPPKTIFNVGVSPHRSYGGYAWHIPEIKRIRKLQPGSTLNDVLIAIIAGGMRRYLQHHNALPVNHSLTAMCPVSIRPEEARHEGGNLISAMFIPIGTDIDDPVLRLEVVARNTKKGVPLAKEVLCDLTNAAGDMIPPYMRAFAGWVEHKARFASRMPLFNTVITNVPGIPGMETKYFAGAKICSVFPLVPVSDGMGISHGMTGIYDWLNLGVLADRKIVQDMDFYITCIDESTREYKALVDALDVMEAVNTDQPLPEITAEPVSGVGAVNVAAEAEEATSTESEKGGQKSAAEDKATKASNSTASKNSRKRASKPRTERLAASAPERTGDDGMIAARAVETVTK
jgi:diacylglycerol O-acyltransferase / wax synthase